MGKSNLGFQSPNVLLQKPHVPKLCVIPQIIGHHDHIHLFHSLKHPESQNMTTFICSIGVILLHVKDRVLDSIRERGHLLIAENEYSVVLFVSRLSDIRKFSFCCLFIFMVCAKKGVLQLVALLNGSWCWIFICIQRMVGLSVCPFIGLRFCICFIWLCAIVVQILLERRQV